ncbi:hypothetical protein BGZ68_007941 [Mortierella alpina]|nr:hypothetical protein BGZ68_007941 [Mortierella alpina]
MYLKLLVTLSTVLTALVAVTSAHKAKNPPSLVIHSQQKKFCMPMPGAKGGSIGDMSDPKVFCTEKGLYPEAEEFPKGFIQSFGIKAEAGYIQVTGVMNRTVYGWTEAERGGRISGLLPHGLQCKAISNKAGENVVDYKFGFIEPDVEHFCFRCCFELEHCDIHNDLAPEKKYLTCQGNLQGDYTKPKPPVVSTQTPNPTSTSLATGTHGTATATSTLPTSTPTKPSSAVTATVHSFGLMAFAIFFAAGLAL